jgi:hypothetical protein
MSKGSPVSFVFITDPLKVPSLSNFYTISFVETLSYQKAQELFSLIRGAKTKELTEKCNPLLYVELIFDKRTFLMSFWLSVVSYMEP